MQIKYSALILIFAVVLPGCSALTSSPPVPIQLKQANDLFIQGELTQAEALYRQLLKQSTGLSIAWFQLGNIYVRTHQLEVATKAFKKAIHINPNEERYWINLVLAQMKQAESNLATARQYHPQSARLNRLNNHLIQRSHESDLK